MEIPNYVMLPVPEQLVPRVMEHMLGLIALDSIKQWDEEAFEPIFHGSSEKAKAVLSLTSRRTLAGKEVTADIVAQALGLSLSEVMSAVRAVNEEGFDIQRPVVCKARSVEEVLPNGRKVQKRLLEMNDHVAKLVQSAEAAEREAFGDGSDAG